MLNVDPDIAVSTMITLWRDFGNEVSTPLLATWRTMCNTLNEAGKGPVGWTALAMPTGIGKTQFAALYCALMPNHTIRMHNLRSVVPHPGVLFVTRFTAEADAFVELVNKHAGRRIAAAHHHKASTSLDDAVHFPVLAITHRACEHHQLHDTFGTSGDTVWDHLTTWHHGRRGKVIIDETPNFITPVQINSNWLSHTLAALKWVPGADKKLYLDMELLLTSVTGERDDHRNRQLSCSEFEDLNAIDVEKMREHLSSVGDYALTLDCGLEKIPLRTICDRTLSALEAIQSNGWAWVSYRWKTPQLNSATLHPSLRHGSGVILDGTAALYTGYSLLSPRAEVISAPANVRNYENVNRPCICLYIDDAFARREATVTRNSPSKRAIHLSEAGHNVDACKSAPPDSRLLRLGD